MNLFNTYTEVDYLTNIGNEAYLNNHYQEYLEKYPNANFIMIDFEKFKAINDTFGHIMGDTYLKTFAKILNDNFLNSLVVRLHGDEYVIVTNYDEVMIKRVFDNCLKEIIFYVENGTLPKTFRFNAGSAPAKRELKQSFYEADCIMYEAKEKQLIYLAYNEAIVNVHKEQDDLIRYVTNAMRTDSFSYAKRKLFTLDGTDNNMYQIYTKTDHLASLFPHYKEFRMTSLLPEFDTYNLNYLLNNMPMDKQRKVILLDYKTVLSGNVDYILYYYKNMIKDIIISIDIVGLEPLNYQKLTMQINKLKSFGLTIRLDKFDDLIAPKVIADINPKYIKINDGYWQGALTNKQQLILLRNQIDLISNLEITPIFEHLSTKNDLDFIKTIAPKDTLVSGNYFSPEKRLVLNNKGMK